jgi:hypothetical protein
VYRTQLAVYKSSFHKLAVCEQEARGLGSREWMAGIYAAYKLRTPLPHVLCLLAWIYECVFVRQAERRMRVVQP